MKIIRFFLLFLLIYPSVHYPQSTTADSLLNLLGSANSEEQKATVLFGISEYWYGKDHDSCFFYSEQLINSALDLEDSRLMFYAYFFMIQSKFDQGNYEEGMLLSHEALDYFQKEDDQVYRANLLVLIAEKNRAKKLYEAAIEYLIEANSIQLTTDDSAFHAQVYNRLAAVKFELGDYNETIEYVELSNKFIGNDHYPNLVVSNYELMGAVYRETGEQEKALASFQKALSLVDQVQDSGILPNLLNNISRTYYELNNNAKALEYAQKSYELAAYDSIKVLMESSSEILAETHTGLGNLNEAIKYLKINHKLEQNFFDEEQDRRISELNMKYESAKKEKQIEEQLFWLKQKNAQNLRLTWVVVISILVLVIIIVTMLKLRKRNQELLVRNEKINRQANELENKNHELMRLAGFKEDLTNMIVHDLKNPLNTIINLSKIRGVTPNCDELIQDSGKQMLYLIQNILDVYKYENSSMDLKQEQISLMQLVKLSINEVLLLAKERNNRFEILSHFDFMVYADPQCLKRIFVNLFTNAIKYSKPDTEIIIQVTDQDEQKVKIEVIDQGEGIEASELKNVFEKYSHLKNRKSSHIGSTGLGLAFCKLAVEAHGGVIDVDSAPGVGSTFSIVLDYLDKQQDPFTRKLHQRSTEKDKIRIDLGPDELTKIIPSIKKLQQLEVYSEKAIWPIIREIQDIDAPGVNDWLSQFTVAVDSIDAVKYNALLHKFIDETEG